MSPSHSNRNYAPFIIAILVLASGHAMAEEAEIAAMHALHEMEADTELICINGRADHIGTVRLDQWCGDEALSHVKAFRHLTELVLNDSWSAPRTDPESLALKQKNVRVTDAGLANIAGLTTLQKLDISNTNLTGSGFRYLQGLNELKVIYADRTQIDDDALRRLESLKSIEELHLFSSKVTDKGMRSISKLPRLRRLTVDNLTDNGLAQLKGLTSLEQLYVLHSTVTDAGLETLRQLTLLTHLNLSNCKGVSDRGIDEILRLPKLQWINLQDTSVTIKGEMRLRSMPSKPEVHCLGP